MKPFTAFVIGLAFFLLADISARADLLFKENPQNDYGSIDQNMTGITRGSVACGPTSVYNSFVFLKNEYGVDLTGASPAATINSLETYMNPGGGTFNGVQNDNDLVNGKVQYIADQGKSNQVVVESLVTDPDAVPGEQAAQFIYDQLAMGQDIEIGFFWSNADGTKTTGGHWVTVTGITFDTTTQTGSVGIVDPWGGVDIPVASIKVVDGKLVLGYSGGGAGPATVDGQDPDNPTNSGFGYITGIAAESVITPIPGSAWAGLLLFGCITGAKVYQGKRNDLV